MVTTKTLLKEKEEEEKGREREREGKRERERERERERMTLSQEASESADKITIFGVDQCRAGMTPSLLLT